MAKSNYEGPHRNLVLIEYAQSLLSQSMADVRKARALLVEAGEEWPTLPAIQALNQVQPWLKTARDKTQEAGRVARKHLNQ